MPLDRAQIRDLGMPRMVSAPEEVMMDADGYPDKRDLNTIQFWSLDSSEPYYGCDGLMAQVHSLWTHAGDWC